MEERVSAKRQVCNAEWSERYSRQIKLDGVGIEGQVFVFPVRDRIGKDSMR